jgi:hypothetical protein
MTPAVLGIAVVDPIKPDTRRIETGCTPGVSDSLTRWNELCLFFVTLIAEALQPSLQPLSALQGAILFWACGVQNLASLLE